MFTTDPFIPGEFEDLLENGEFNQDIEVIAGTNENEGITYFFSEIGDPTLWENWRKNFDTIGPMTLFNIGNASELTTKDVENAHKLLEYYVGSVDDINEENQGGMLKMLTDSGFLFGVHNGIRQGYLDISIKVSFFSFPPCNS